MTLALTKYPDGAAFLAASEATLAQHEAANNLMYGIAVHLRDHPERIDATPYLAAVHEDSRLVAAAVMTPPRNVLLFGVADDAYSPFTLIAADLIAGNWRPPGVNAMSAHARIFAECWAAATGQSFAVATQLRVFELRKVIHPTAVPGLLRLATANDEAVVWRWYREFAAEAQPHEAVLPERETVGRSIMDGNVFLWDNDGPVSLAAKGRQLPHGLSVGPVYTPPSQRGRGYASACVAALSQLILDRGWRFCTLFTDLANPTSNSIYQKIGYVPVCDFTEYVFRM